MILRVLKIAKQNPHQVLTCFSVMALVFLSKTKSLGTNAPTNIFKGCRTSFTLTNTKTGVLGTKHGGQLENG